MVLNLPVLTQKKAICTVQNKNVITKICWFVQKPFSNAHVNE
ncbi:hypothetical protein AB205_0083400 [Aquarana catesbeiana]|uniref:Uncharacterized protein n=1 Tax=Aquarana catesbeiana TaxID=8400 RepID=A0A2G9PMN8_AQUCT|nr:hypothetical protein AB205_0083400 [Aquarana catesbeiana]